MDSSRGSTSTQGPRRGWCWVLGPSGARAWHARDRGSHRITATLDHRSSCGATHRAGRSPRPECRRWNGEGSSAASTMSVPTSGATCLGRRAPSPARGSIPMSSASATTPISPTGSKSPTGDTSRCRSPYPCRGASGEHRDSHLPAALVHPERPDHRHRLQARCSRTSHCRPPVRVSPPARRARASRVRSSAPGRSSPARRPTARASSS